MPPDFDAGALRALFPVTQHSIYLNHAAAGLMSTRVQAAIQRGLRLMTDQGPHAFRKEIDRVSAELRAGLARLIGSEPGEIAFVPNTATGLNMAALSLPLRAGDNVLLCDQEYPALAYAFMNLEQTRGIAARVLPHDGGGPTVALLDRYADDRTRAVAVSSVQFLSGFRADLAAIGAWCRARRVWLIVDAIQSLGVVPLSVGATPVDILVAGGYKWLLGPPGVGFMFVRQDCLKELRPALAGAASVAGVDNYLDYRLDFWPSAERFELGVPNRLGHFGFLESVHLLLEIGIAPLHAWTLHLTDHLLRGLDRLGYEPIVNRQPQHRSAIVSFRVPPPHTPGALSAALSQAHVIHSVRHGCIRLAPHGYNTEAEIEQVIEILRRCQP